jgi:Flp pilus assembly protein TadG
MKRLDKKVFRDEAGTVAIIFALVLMALVGAAGGAIDYGRAISAKSKLSTAADAAALAGAVAPQSERIGVATNSFKVNHGGTVTPSVTVNGSVVRVVASQAVPSTLLAVIGIRELPVSVESEAVIGAASAAPQCILLLEPNDIGLYANSGAKLDANCDIQINSDHSTEALFVNSASHITATAVRVHGTSKLNSGSTVAPAPVDGSAPQADPLASLAEPSSGPCTYTDFTVNSGQTRTMTPGVYCKKTLINSGSIAIMTPGVYVFRDGEFEINSLSTVTGSGVMMFFENKSARLKVNSFSVFEVSAPTSGTYAGLLMFQGRHPDNADAWPFVVNSNGSTKLEGTIYLPRGTLELNSLSTANQSAAYTAIVARDMVLNSFGTMTVRSNFGGPTPLPPLLASFKNVTVAHLTK